MLFPKADEQVLRDMIVLSPHEESAVARLLVLGYEMWCVEDYKLLRFAAKKHRDHRKQGGMTQKWGANRQQRSKHGKARTGQQQKKQAGRPEKQESKKRKGSKESVGGGRDVAMVRVGVDIS